MHQSTTHEEHACACGHEHTSTHEEHISKWTISRFITGGLGFGAGLILPKLLSMPDWGVFTIFALSYLLVGGDVVYKACKGILRGRMFDEHFLMALASIAAFAIGQAAEGVAVMLFYQVGEMVSDYAVGRSRRSISSLMDIRPDYANVQENGVLRRVSPQEVPVGAQIVIKAGEKVPLDGEVIEGFGTLDTSALTGESLPRDVQVGDEVLSGTINQSGLLTVCVTKPFGQSTVSIILDMVQNASARKAPTERFITKFARIYTPIVVGIAAVLAFVPPLILADGSFSMWLGRALVFLVASCPCALVISIPLGFFGGIGGASRQGVLVKGSHVLETLRRVDTVVFDKTGTLTQGVFEVSSIHAAHGVTQDEILSLAAHAQHMSNHPIARSILKTFTENGGMVDVGEIGQVQEIAGQGMHVIVSGKRVLCGNAALLQTHHIAFAQPVEVGTIVHVAFGEAYLGYILINDTIKPDSKKAIDDLKAAGLTHIVMLTGDNEQTAQQVAQKLGIQEVHASLLPGEKVACLEEIQRKQENKGKIMFVGDGINDAPVLMRADVGVAMGALGSDAAMEAADVVLMNDQPTALLKALHMAKRTHVIVWQNIFFAFAIKAAVLVLGAGGLASMWEAVFADVGVALLAILNAMRVMRSKG